MIKLETERLILRNYEIDDIAAVHDYFSNEEVARYEDFYPMSMEEVKEIVKEWIPLDNRLVAIRKEDQRLIGSVGYWVDEEGHHCIDYDFNPAFSKKGYATEAATELIKHLFENKEIDALYGDCDIRNVDSCKLLERLGFQRIEQIDDASYKDDPEGNPIKISICLYRYGRKNDKTG